MKAEYITHMGDDLMVVNSARVSFDKESALLSECWNCDWRGEYPGTDACPACGEDNAGWERKDEQQLAGADTKLIGYLARHNHWTPFSHPQITLRETVPIFVARQR